MKTFKVVFLTLFALLLAGCSDDDNDPNVNINGKVSVAYAGATTENYSVAQATFIQLYQNVEGV